MQAGDPLATAGTGPAPGDGAAVARSVFVSYASRDVTAAEATCQHLEAAGIRCWIAPRDVPAGALYAEAIVNAINGCRVLALLLSEASVGSAHVGKEIERASSKRRPIIAIRLDEAPLPPALEYFLSESQWIDARGGLKPALLKLTDGLVRLLAADAVALPLAAEPQPSPSRAVRTGRTLGATVAGVAVLLGLWFAAERYWWSHASGTPQRDAAHPAATAAVRQSIAVLPFTDLSEKKDQEYFSDGLSEELIDLLGRIPGLRVPARTSSFYFKGRQATLADIGQALNVTHVLEGSVRKAGKALRITTELVSVGDDSRVWSATYDRTLDDVFKVQDDIANSVVAALKVSMLGATPARATPTENSEAYLHFLKALEGAHAGNEASLALAIAEAKQAVALDPNFADAWRVLGSATAAAFSGFGRGSYEVAHRDAVAALGRALEIQPDLPQAHTALSRIYYIMDWDAPRALQELQKVRAIDSSAEDVLWMTGYIANSEGRFDEAISAHTRGLELDPLASHHCQQLGNAYYRAGKLNEAARELRQCIERFPSASTNHYRLGLVLLAQGGAEEALATFRLETDQDFNAVGVPLALDRLGRTAQAAAALARALASGHVTRGAAYQVALIYAGRHDREKAFEWLERAYRQHDGGMRWLKFDPLLKELTPDPRFQSLLARMHFS